MNEVAPEDIKKEEGKKADANKETAGSNELYECSAGHKFKMEYAQPARYGANGTVAYCDWCNGMIDVNLGLYHCCKCNEDFCKACVIERRNLVLRGTISAAK